MRGEEISKKLKIFMTSYERNFLPNISYLKSNMYKIGIVSRKFIKVRLDFILFHLAS